MDEINKLNQTDHIKVTNDDEHASIETASLLLTSPRILSKFIEYSENENAQSVHESNANNYGIVDEKEDMNMKDGGEQSKKPIKRLREDEMLKFNNPMPSDEEFDSYGDQNQIYRKYRLRANQKDYTEKPDHTPQLKPGGTYHCTQCPKKFDSKTGLLNHRRMHQTKTIYTCALCFETFNTNALLIAHKEIHIQEKRSYFCVQCKLAFSDHCDFLIHSLSHTNRTTYKCIECGVYYSKNGYKAHITTHYGRKKECPICSTMISQQNFNSHVKSHDRTCICIECGKDCRTPSYYKEHILIHTGVRPFQCLYCGKGFINSQQRRVHTRIHTNERPFSCSECTKSFKQVTDMLRHKMSHGQYKQYQCDYCKKMFRHKNYLRSHMRGHMQDGLYECPECNSEFTTMSGLRAHVNYKHTSERPFRCELCDMQFMNNSQYTRHTNSKAHMRNAFAIKD